MATQNKTREGTRNQKKSPLVLAANLTIADYVATADIVELFELPENVHMVRAHLNVKTAFNAGTSITFTVNIGGNVFVAAISVATTGIKTLTLTQRDSGIAGAKVTMVPTIVGAIPTTGEAELIIEGLEYTKNTGEFTEYSAT